MFGNPPQSLASKRPGRGQEEARKSPRNLSLEPPKLCQEEARKRPEEARKRPGRGLANLQEGTRQGLVLGV